MPNPIERMIMETETKPDTPAPGAATDISLVRGGPFYRLLVAIRLIDAKRWNVGRRILFVLAVVWLPVVVMRLVLWPSHIMQLLLDYRLDARALIAAPVLILADPIMDSRFRVLVEHIRKSHLLVGPDLAKMDDILAGLPAAPQFLFARTGYLARHHCSHRYFV